jgi:hypothetical protein
MKDPDNTLARDFEAIEKFHKNNPQPTMLKETITIDGKEFEVTVGGKPKSERESLLGLLNGN